MESEKVYNVSVAHAANDRMYEHFEFLAHVSPEAANRLLDGLLMDIRSLNKMPFSNPPYNRPHLPQGKYRYKISQKKYRIVYQVQGEDVFVDDIQDCRQDDGRSVLCP